MGIAKNALEDMVTNHMALTRKKIDTLQKPPGINRTIPGENPKLQNRLNIRSPDSIPKL